MFRPFENPAEPRIRQNTKAPTTYRSGIKDSLNLSLEYIYTTVRTTTKENDLRRYLSVHVPGQHLQVVVVVLPGRPANLVRRPSQQWEQRPQVFAQALPPGKFKPQASVGRLIPIINGRVFVSQGSARASDEGGFRASHPCKN